MKTRKVVTMLAVAAALMTGMSAGAQSLGGLLKKAKNGVEKLAGNAQPQDSVAANVVVVATGASVANPIEQYMTVEPVGLFPAAQDENCGNLYMVLQVTNYTEKPSATFGSSIRNQKMLAVDGAGTVYNINSSGAFRYDTPQDVTVRIELSEPDLQFVNVSKTLTVMPVVKLGINIDAARQGNLTFRDVPIYRDVESAQ